jgi:hypothetical protein
MIELFYIQGEEVMIATSLLIMIVWLFTVTQQLYTETLRQQNRIIRLSYNLQLAEYQTGIPYYTDISLPPMHYETQLLEMYRARDERQPRKRSASL